MYVGIAADDSRDGGGRAAPGAAAESNGRFRRPCLTRHLCFLHVAGSDCRGEGGLVAVFVPSLDESRLRIRRWSVS
ncbi:MAG: hypothetical protein HY083_02650 [Gammaproteobacteria bacterium]|nr:hypothetical protein [Gammaproteobacteria bacterium]